jgi:hypothetical protein
MEEVMVTLFNWIRGGELILRAITTAVAVSVCVPVTPAHSQTVQRVPSAAMCERCRITLTQVARIGTASDPYSIRDITTAAIGSTTIFFGPLYEAGRVGRFDLTTKRGSLIGRPGSGPGELRTVLGIAAGRTDSLTVLSGGRLTVFTNTGGFVRVSSAQAIGRNLLVLPDGSVLISGIRRTPESAGHPLHLLTRDGGFVKSFGEARDTIRSNMSAAELAGYRAGATLTRSLSKAESGGVWAAHGMKYQIDRFDGNGRYVRSIIRDAAWFPPRRAAPETSSWEAPPPPFLVAVSEYEELLWVAVTVADRNWKAVKTDEWVPARAKDTIIEVIDPRRGRVVTSARLDGVVIALGNGLVITHEEDADGLLFLRVSRLVVTGL